MMSRSMRSSCAWAASVSSGVSVRAAKSPSRNFQFSVVAEQLVLLEPVQQRGHKLEHRHQHGNQGHKALYGMSGEVPDDPDFMIPFGHARLARAGEDVTIVSSGLLLGFCEAVADKLAAEGIGCDVIDLRTTSPLDEETILDSVEVTGRLLVVDEARRVVALPPICVRWWRTRPSPASRRRRRR